MSSEDNYRQDDHRNYPTGNSNRRFNERDDDPYRPDHFDEYERYPEDEAYYLQRPERDYRQNEGYDNERHDRNDGSYSDSRRNAKDYDWQDYERNRRDYQEHPERYQAQNGRRQENYNEKPWFIDRFAEKIEGVWNRWVNKSYHDHSPDSDYSW